MRTLLTFSLAMLAAFGLYSMGTDAAERVPGPLGGWLPQTDANHAPAAVPVSVNYQGRLVDSTTGNPLPDGSYSVRFSVHTALTGGTEVGSQLSVVSTQDGVFSAMLVMPASVFNATPRFLEVKVGADPPLTTRQLVSSVPFAYFANGAALANNAELLDGIDSTQFLRSDVAATQASNLTVAGNLVANGTTTLGNGVGNDTTIANGDVTVNGGTQLGDSLSDTTTITGPVATLADVAVGGDISVEGNNIDTGLGGPDLRIDANVAAAGSILLGGSTGQGDDVQIVDGSLCVGSAGCNSVPADGSLQVDGAIAARSSSSFDSDIAIGNDPAFDGTARITFSADSNLTWDSTDAVPRFQFSDRVDIGGGLCIAAAASQCDGVTMPAGTSIRTQGSIFANNFDLAEHFPAADDDLAPGDLVMFGDGAAVRRTDGTPYDARIAGIVSGEPGLALGWGEEGEAAVALQGRVPLNVTLENGPIASGDYLTSSSTPGKAMRATEPGPIAGIALQAYDGSGDAQVLTFVALGERNVGALVDRIERLEAELADGGGAPSQATSAVAAADGGVSTWMAIAMAMAGACAAVGAGAAGVLLRARVRA